jgi:hypothetical protein
MLEVHLLLHAWNMLYCGGCDIMYVGVAGSNKKFPHYSLSDFNNTTDDSLVVLMVS